MKLRIDRVRGGPEERPIDRWELLADGRLVLSLEADDLHALTAEAMRADGQRQGLVLVGEQQPTERGAPAGQTAEKIARALEYTAQAQASCGKIEGLLYAVQMLATWGEPPPHLLNWIESTLAELDALLDARNQAKAMVYAAQTAERYRGWHNPEQAAGGKGV